MNYNPIPSAALRQTPPWGVALLATVFSTVFSPSLWLLKMTLSPWIDWHSLLAQSASPIDLLNAFYALTLHLQSLGSLILFTQILPLLLLCMGISLGYYWLILQLFTRASQRLQRSRQTIS